MTMHTPAAALAAAAIALAALSGCSSPTTTAPPQKAAASHTAAAPADGGDVGSTDPGVHHAVVYSLTGTGSAQQVDYGDAATSNSLKSVRLPWTHQFSDTDMYAAYSVSGMRGAGAGTITCTISVNGKVVAKHTAQGEYAFTDCTANLP